MLVASSVALAAVVSPPLRAIVAGGGIGGLAIAGALQAQGWQVSIAEKTAAYRHVGGPIQIASNALAAVQSLSSSLMEDITSESVPTGAKLNGLKDLHSDEMLAGFDLKAPALARGLPLTVVVERARLQACLLARLPPEALRMGTEVVGYARGEGGGVVVTLRRGEVEVVEEADLLIGADGIWSRVRSQMHQTAPRAAAYSGYRLFAACCRPGPGAIGGVGYQVHVANGKYFVSCDVGRGRVQWYAFVSCPSASEAEAAVAEENRLSPLLDAFGCSAEVARLLASTSPADVDLRAAYDRAPEVLRGWTDGPVGLLGDAAHPMLPNLGQGGGQALESAAALGEELAAVRRADAIPAALRRYERRRMGRAAAVQGMSRLPGEMLRLWPSGGRFLRVVPEGWFLAAQRAALPGIFAAQFDFLFSVPCPPRAPPGAQEGEPGGI